MRFSWHTVGIGHSNRGGMSESMLFESVDTNQEQWICLLDARKWHLRFKLVVDAAIRVKQRTSSKLRTVKSG